MPILIAIAGAEVAALFWYKRMKNTASSALELADDAAGVMRTVLNAPRRIALRRQTGAHPVERIEDPRVAVAALGQALLERDGRGHQEALFNILPGLAGPDGLSAAQQNAVEDIRVAMRLSPR